MGRSKAKSAAHIADILEGHGVGAIPGDCSGGVVDVVVIHEDGSPNLHEARGAEREENEDGTPHWEEHLLYEGDQLGYALSHLRGLDASATAAEVLAIARGAQDVCA